MGKKRQKTKRRAAAVRRRTVILGIFVAAAALLVIIVINSMLRRTVEKYDPDIIIDGVSIGDTDVSGMTAEEAKTAVTEDAGQISGGLIVFTLEDGREARATLKELGMTVKDLEELTEQAADYGKKGSLVECYKILKASEKGGQKNYPVQYQITEESAGEVLAARMNSILEEPENAAIIQKDGTAVIQEDVPGEALNLEKTVAAMEPITSVVEKTDGVRGMAREIFSGLPSEYALEELEIRNMDWKCDCSEERLAKVLMTIGKKDLKEIIEEDNEAELVCQFCLKKYKFDKAHLERILASAEK